MTGPDEPHARRLIVNADDLGQCPGVNRGTFEAADAGIVTSASLMVRWPSAESAVASAQERPELSLGLHVDLGEWTVRDGTWRELYRVADPADTGAVASEITDQIESFRRMVGRPPTHLDAHQHVHREEPVRSLMLAAAQRLGIPVRGESSVVAYCGSFYGQFGSGHPYPEGITVDALLAILDALPVGTTELGCHPGTGALDDLHSMYASERLAELDTLCDPRVRRALADLQIELCSFDDLVNVHA
jgi:predicted glycoside hydrolase/deacetylase ChbG (UPF0249 family)